MWCTRWFLPLLLLPLPIAPPYFLLLFLVSLTLQARPCFYCIILLTALFTSSCYWQPVPTHTLFQSTLTNVSETLPLLYLPNTTGIDEKAITENQLIPVPKLTTLSDRCWCELSHGRLFDPLNATSWQLSSISRTLGVQSSKRVIVAQDAEDGTESSRLHFWKIWIFKLSSAAEKEKEKEKEKESQENTSNNQTTSSWGLSSLSRGFPFKSFRSPKSDKAEPPAPQPEPIAPSPVTNATGVSSIFQIQPIYDLRPFGLNLLIDTRWGRRSSA
ncbi:hypothetical protein M422DRAFT_24849 [Sphaerobolus stellatus SS14]|nr:hypothetical protein M422DRAFT_24849 [Sphaerobolus stellatus SS14]